MPGVTKNIDAFVENLLAQPGFSCGRGVGAAAFISAAGIEAKAEQVVGGLGLQDNGINTRLEGMRILRLKRLSDGFAANARRVEFRHVEMIAQEIAGTSSIRRARRHREADQTRSMVMEVAVLGGRCHRVTVRVMKTGPDDLLLLARVNDFVNGFGAV